MAKKGATVTVIDQAGKKVEPDNLHIVIRLAGGERDVDEELRADLLLTFGGNGSYNAQTVIQPKRETLRPPRSIAIFWPQAAYPEPVDVTPEPEPIEDVCPCEALLVRPPIAFCGRNEIHQFHHFRRGLTRQTYHCDGR